MRVGIIVPNRDQGRFLEEALDSVFAQTGIDLQVAVVDGDSKDNSLAIIRRNEEKLAYWRSCPDRGQAAAINEGIQRLENTDYVGWLNADDVLLPGALSRLVWFLTRHQECAAVFGKACLIDEAGQVIGEYPVRPFKRREFARACTICQPASIIRHRAWDAVGGLDESLEMCLDYDLWWRLSKVGRIGFLPEFVACTRDYPATKTRTRKNQLYQEAFRVLQRHLGYVPLRWCLSETAYTWRASHRGERARGFASQLVCVYLALQRYVRVNGVSGLINAFAR